MADESGPTQMLAVVIDSDADEIGASFFLDLYDQDPDQGGDSVLATLTGSATRTNYAAVMLDSGLSAANDTIITVVTEAEDSASVGWVVIFDAATAGNILMSGELVNPQVVTMWNGAAFAVGALQVLLEPDSFDGQWDFSDPIQSAELLTAGIF